MIKRLTFKNCFCFRGEHEILLQPKVYSIAAKYEDVEGRSNWGGKSSLMKLLGPMPLFGWHNDTEDGWITEGENDAFYEVETFSGYKIRRERIRGKSTQVKLTYPDGREVGQKGAQDVIEEWLNLSQEDFFAGFYFKQKDIDKLITIRPGDRQDLISNWFDLSSLQRSEDDARAEFNETVKLLTTAEAELKVVQDALEDAQSPEFYSEVAKVRKDEIEKLLKLIEGQNELVTRVASAQFFNAKIDSASERLDYIVSEGKKLKTEIDSVTLPDMLQLKSQSRMAEEQVDEIHSKCAQLHVLAKGEFDGECPVSKGFQCPAKASINADREKHTLALKTALQEHHEASSLSNDLSEKLRIATAAEKALDKKKYQLDALRKDWAKYDALAKEPKQEVPYYDPDMLNQLNQKLGELRTEAKHLEETSRKVVVLWDRRTELEKKVVELTLKRNRLAEAAKLFKIAQNKCAKEGLEKIEENANSLLLAAGIDLSISAKWEHEGKDPAKVCYKCGEPFPTSRKYKDCAKCGEARGLNIIDKLVIKLSNRSGGAEDLGGLSLQLAAASWLRAKKGSNFDTVFLDEPISALDEFNRKALGGQIARMLSGKFGFGQAFLVTHDQSFDSMFPGQIQILVKKNGERVVTAV